MEDSEWESYDTFLPGRVLLGGRRAGWCETIMRRRLNGSWQYREMTPLEAEKSLYGDFTENDIDHTLRR